MLVRLKEINNLTIRAFDIGDTAALLEQYLDEADFIFHIAGVNRPDDEREFETINVGLTKQVIEYLQKKNKRTPLVFTSSTQALLSNPYGKSKQRAEEIILGYAAQHNAKVFVYRLPNVFGKWCKPNYNSVVATYCYNIAHQKDIHISNKKTNIELVYIDDVVEEFVDCLMNVSAKKGGFCSMSRSFNVTLEELAQKINLLHQVDSSLIIPDLSDIFMKYLYATYITYRDDDDLACALETKSDNRGSLTELFKSYSFGQIFVARSHSGIMRGNHYHHTKIEKFCVLQGDADITLRHIVDQHCITITVTDKKMTIVDIPPGYMHTIKNRGTGELIVIFWASEIFNKEKTDTHQ
jgi:UDP-2-acetamido-2,6-beta-L-arabino-hexul-4-ose reductase